MLNYGSLLFSPKGRVRRRLYWRASMIFLVASSAPSIIPRVGFYIGAVFSLVAFYGFACLYTKRLHDLGRSGWWQLTGWALLLGPLVLVPLAVAMTTNFALTAPLGDDPRSVINALFGMAFLALAACGGLHLLLGVLRGQNGANRFGPDPGQTLEMDIFD